MEAALGVLALLLVAVCVLAWRLAQGPIDLTWLMRREHALVALPGAQFTLGGADLAWEGFAERDQPLVVRLRDVALSLPDDGPKLHLARARIRFAEGQLLLGRFMPRSIAVSGADLQFWRDSNGAFRLGTPTSQTKQGSFVWPAALSRISVQDASMTVHDAALGLDWRASGVALDAGRAADGGLAGQGQAILQAGGVQTHLSLQAVPKSGSTQISAALTPINPASLALASARLGALAQVDAPITADLTVGLDAKLKPVDGQLNATFGPGTLAVRKGAVRFAGAVASLSATEFELRLDNLRLTLAPPGAGTAGPTITAAGRATRANTRVHAGFSVAVDEAAMADLSQYWPAGTGGGARAWLTRNITAGTARQVRLAAEIEAPDDLSDASLTALSGSLVLDDATVWWLRPVPPLVHVTARMTIEGPDALRIVVQHGEQDRLCLLPGSSIRITGLQARDQFGDIDASLSGPVADALLILDHPRLKLLSRGGVAPVEPAGSVRGRLTMHMPLDDRVTMDDIAIGATAQLTRLHLGRVAAGRDLDQADLSVKVTESGLTIAGQGAIAGIAAKLALDMDFRGGPPSQILQHVTAQGAATPAQLLAAGLPASAVRVLTGGSAGLRVDYTGRRSAVAALQVDADLGQASVATALGWSKPAGQQATAGGTVILDHGRLSGVDNLHAEGSGLSIVSHAVVSSNVRILQFQRFELGRTSAHGQIGFPVKANGPINVALSGPSLDLSTYFARSDPQGSPDDKPGLPWSAKLDFDKVFLAHQVSFAPLHVDAASDGRRILRASASAGAGLTASIIPGHGTRRVTAEAADAGGALAGLGVVGLSGGTLRLDGTLDDSTFGDPLTGTARLDNFNLRDAPAIGRLLQVMTLYGVADTLHGPGLHFSHLVAPFRWQRRVLYLSNARAFSPSLGLTADGDVDLSRRVADVQGTVVPAYFFNQLLGDLPLVGRLFSPEKGGGVFAARYSVRGPLANPKLGVNPLSALTPGFLRGVFGLFDRRPAADAPDSAHVQ